MTLDDVVAKLRDLYDLQARLYLALLCVLLLLALVVPLRAPDVSALTGVATLAVSCGGLFFMTNICREMSKRLEGKLFRDWGGEPTTQLLRHRDTPIDSVTERRYQAFLAVRINIAFSDLLCESNSNDCNACVNVP